MKKNLILSAFLFILITQSFGQDKKFHFGVSFNPNYSYRIYTTNDKSSFSKRFFDSVDASKFSYSAGFFAERQLSQRLKVRVGLNFMKTGFGSIKNNISSSWGSQGGSTNTKPDSSLPVAASRYYNAYYIEIPLDFQYFIGQKKRFFVNLGMSPCINFLNETASKLYYLDGKTTIQTLEDRQTDNRKVAIAV